MRSSCRRARLSSSDPRSLHWMAHGLLLVSGEYAAAPVPHVWGFVYGAGGWRVMGSVQEGYADGDRSENWVIDISWGVPPLHIA